MCRLVSATACEFEAQPSRRMHFDHSWTLAVNPWVWILNPSQGFFNDIGGGWGGVGPPSFESWVILCRALQTLASTPLDPLAFCPFSGWPLPQCGPVWAQVDLCVPPVWVFLRTLLTPSDTNQGGKKAPTELKTLCLLKVVYQVCSAR